MLDSISASQVTTMEMNLQQHSFMFIVRF